VIEIPVWLIPLIGAIGVLIGAIVPLLVWRKDDRADRRRQAVNKADRPGVENTERALRSTLELAHPTKRLTRHHGRAMKVDAPRENEQASSSSQNPEPMWVPPILKTVSTEGKGFTELAEAIARHVRYLRESGDWQARDRARLGSELDTVLQEALVERFMESMSKGRYEEILEKVLNRTLSPYEAVESLLDGESTHL
jgi:LAO/AO transport system kinase